MTLLRQARLADQQSESWRTRLGAGLDAALAHLSEYLVVRRRDVPYEPLMDPQWEGLVRQNLRLLIEQAHYALVAADNRLFHDALSRADQWLTQLQDADADELGVLRQELQDLSQQSVQPGWPEQLRALAVAEAALIRRSPRG
jgi:uroporphyrin-3 C-methyltransferase